jgi:putative transposase
VTICTNLRRSYFGNIANGHMSLSDMGRIAEQCWREIPKHFENVELDEYVIMPNHVHGIFMITNPVQPHAVSRHPTEPERKFGPLPSKSLHTIIGSYKSAVTKLIHAKGSAFGWQSRFHDHIIRNEKELNNIRQYIDNNPAKWELDRENPDPLRNLKILNQPASKERMNIFPDQIASGLCPTCKHMFRVETPRGSVFIMCKLSKRDPSFPKYPRLPVLECLGYSPTSWTGRKARRGSK